MIYRRKRAKATIALDGTLSGAVPIGGAACALLMPAAWTAATITFQAGHEEAGVITYRDLYDQDGDEVELTVAVDRHVILNPAEFLGVEHLKIRSGTAAAPVQQVAAREIYVIYREMG